MAQLFAALLALLPILLSLPAPLFAQQLPVHCPHAEYLAPPGGWADLETNGVEDYPEFVVLFGDEITGGAHGEDGETGGPDQDGTPGTPGLDGPVRTLIARTVFLHGDFDLSGGNGGSGGRGGPASWSPGPDYCGLPGRPGDGGNGADGGHGGRLTIICENLVLYNVKIDVSGGHGGHGGFATARDGNCVCLGEGSDGGHGGQGGNTGQVIFAACNRYELGMEPVELGIGLTADMFEPRRPLEIVSCTGQGGNGGDGVGIRFGQGIGRGVPGNGGNGGLSGLSYMSPMRDDYPTTPAVCSPRSGVLGRGGQSAGTECEVGQLEGKRGIYPPRHYPVMTRQTLVNPFCDQLPQASFAAASERFSRPDLGETAVTVALDEAPCSTATVHFSAKVDGDGLDDEIVVLGDDRLVFDGDMAERFYRGPEGGEVGLEEYFDESLGRPALHFFGNTSDYQKNAMIGYFWEEKRSIISFRARANNPPPAVPRLVVYVQTSDGRKFLEYFFASGKDRLYDNTYLQMYLGEEYNTDHWFLIKRDMAADIEKMMFGVRYLHADRLIVPGNNIRLADFRFSHPELRFEPGETTQLINVLFPLPNEMADPGRLLFSLEQPTAAGLGERTEAELLVVPEGAH